MVQKSITDNEQKHMNINQLILQRKSKDELFTKNWSKVILKDVDIYNYSEKSDDYYYDMDTTSKYIKIKLSSIDENYNCEFIIKPCDTGVTKIKPEKLFKILYNKKGDIISMGKLPSYGYSIRVDKSINSSYLWTFFESILRIIGPKIIYVLSWILLTLSSLIIHELTNIGGILLLFVSQYLFMFISNFIYMYLKYKLNNKWFRISQSEDIQKISESTNISNSIIKEIELNKNKSYIFSKDIAHINSFSDGRVILENNNAKWTFEPEDDVISEEAIELYKNSGGKMEDNTDIPVYISEYKSEYSNDNVYISDCENWVLNKIDI